MGEFHYQAREVDGAAVSGIIEATDRRDALRELAARGLYPSALELCARSRGSARERPRGEPRPEAETRAEPAPGSGAAADALDRPEAAPAKAAAARNALPDFEPVSGRIRRKEITAFTREMATLLGATIPIPAALQGLGAEEQNPALRGLLLQVAAAVRSGSSLSSALESYPRLFPKLYTSMIRVGEETGSLDKVMADLADVLEHEDEIRGEVLEAVAYPAFVLSLGVLTTFILLTFVLPRLFGMLQGMMDALPLPTRILLAISTFFQAYWPWVLGCAAAAAVGLRWYARTPAGALLLDSLKLRLPILGPLFRATALARFARTLGTLAHSGVSLLPALEISRWTVGNRIYSRLIDQVAEETRGGESLAAPLRRLGLFPSTLVQMIAVGEETGRLDAMLLRVAAMEERAARGRSRTLISLLAPALILVVGALVGFIVIALLLPIFQMSQAIR